MITNSKYKSFSRMNKLSATTFFNDLIYLRPAPHSPFWITWISYNIRLCSHINRLHLVSGKLWRRYSHELTYKSCGMIDMNICSRCHDLTTQDKTSVKIVIMSQTSFELRFFLESNSMCCYEFDNAFWFQGASHYALINFGISWCE